MKLIYDKISLEENDRLFVKEEDFQMFSNQESLEPTLNLISTIENSILFEKTIIELFSFNELSLWWFFHPTIFPVLKNTINFIQKFNDLLDKIEPDEIVVNDFKMFNIISQISKQRKIPLKFSKSKLSNFILKNKLKNKLQKSRFKKITLNKVNTRKKLFHKNFNHIPLIENKIIFATPSTYFREINNSKINFSSSEFLIQNLVDLLDSQNNIIGIDLDYTFKGDFKVLENRLKSKIPWFPIEILNDKNYKKQIENFLNQYKKIISTTDFHNLFNFDGIKLWNNVEEKFKELMFEPYIPFYINLIYSLFENLKKQKPKAIFLPYETGPYALALILAAKKNGIKTIGQQHGIIYKFSPMYSFQNFYDSNNKFGFPLPDYLLLFGNLTKKILIDMGYPEKKLIVFGNPSFFEINTLEKTFSKEEILSLLNIPKNKSIILFTTGKLQPYYSAHGKYDQDVKILNNLLENFSNKDDIFIIVKPHPSETNIDAYEQLISKFSAKNILITQTNLHALFYICSLVISVGSTTILDALCFDKLVLRVKFENQPYSIPLENYNFVIECDLPDLYNNILNLLKNDFTMNNFSVERKKFIKKIYNIPQSNSKKILDELLS